MAARRFLTIDCRITLASSPHHITSPHVLTIEVADDSPLLPAPIFSLEGHKYGIIRYSLHPFMHESPGIETIDCPITLSDTEIKFYSDSGLDPDSK